MFDKAARAVLIRPVVVRLTTIRPNSYRYVIMRLKLRRVVKVGA